MKLREWEECCRYMQASIDEMNKEYDADIRLRKVMFGNSQHLEADIYDSGGYLYRSFTALIPSKEDPDGISAKERSVRNIDKCMSEIEKEVFA